MRNISKQKHAEFRNVMIGGLMALQATPIDDYWHLTTKYGILRVHIDDAGGCIFTVFTRFQDVVRAVEHLDCNPYSGKWNFHTTGEPAAQAGIIIDRLVSVVHKGE